VKVLEKVEPLVAEVKPLFEPVVQVERRPTPADPPEVWRYARTYLLLRVVVGVVGILLPPFLIVLDSRIFQDVPESRGSLSAYYYSGGREIFVAALVLMGTVLGTYKIFERNLDNLCSALAGLAAVAIALFPTGLPSDTTVPTPLQRELSVEWVERIHYGAAATLIVLLGVVSITFGIREGNRDPKKTQKLSPYEWRRYHFLCAAIVFAALATYVVAKVTVELPNLLLFAEWAAVWAFAASWFAAGWEWPVLRGRRPPD
jgi:hypothetical protein